MSKEFNYVTYIKSTPEKVWEAITSPEFTRQYWGHQLVSDWKTNSKWEMLRNADQSLNVIGKVVESAPPKRLVLSWAESDKLEDESQVRFDIEMANGMVKLSVTHADLSDYMASRVSGGWPLVLSGLKTLIETGHTLSADGGGCKAHAA